MPCDFVSIRSENERRYGTDIGRVGPMLLANRYDNRTHFIYELLQNAEDALARRGDWSGSHAVVFESSETELRISHYGAPFTEADVRGICGIAETTKELTAIGRFGIGFKSVYAFTKRPEIHSGDEHFGIENFVWPVSIPPCGCQREDETVFILPLDRDDAHAQKEIAAGLHQLGPRVLLFLRHIEEISWAIKDGATGVYLRSKPEHVSANSRKIAVIGEQHGVGGLTEETWMVFSREVRTKEGVSAGFVEVAFALVEDEDTGTYSVRPVTESSLVVFFPTVVATHLGFLVQGPYRTTPSRDNVPRQEPWNQHLVRETAILLVDALRELRDLGMLDTSVLRTLPLDRSKFAEGQMFAPLFDVVRKALSSEPLLPVYGGAHAPAVGARLGRTQELRDLISASQLAALLGEEGELCWLSGEISQDRTPELRRYLMQELGVTELTPDVVIAR